MTRKNVPATQRLLAFLEEDHVFRDLHSQFFGELHQLVAVAAGDQAADDYAGDIPAGRASFPVLLEIPLLGEGRILLEVVGSKVLNQGKERGFSPGRESPLLRASAAAAQQGTYVDRAGGGDRLLQFEGSAYDVQLFSGSPVFGQIGDGDGQRRAVTREEPAGKSVQGSRSSNQAAMPVNAKERNILSTVSSLNPRRRYGIVAAFALLWCLGLGINPQVAACYDCHGYLYWTDSKRFRAAKMSSRKGVSGSCASFPSSAFCTFS